MEKNKIMGKYLVKNGLYFLGWHVFVKWIYYYLYLLNGDGLCLMMCSGE